MKLLVDIGNSCVKWSTLDKDGLSDSQHFMRSKSGIKASLTKAWKSLENIQNVFVSNVAGDKIASQLSEWTEKSWQITPEFVATEKRRFGVSNAYGDPAKLGVDRWLSLIAARQHARQAQCIIDCGTAITVDIVTRTGQHQGGMILPGLSLMKKALIENTEALNDEVGEADFKTLAINTSSAIKAGTLYTACAAIERIINDLGESFNHKIRFIITGGDAESLLPLLGDSVVHYPDIVLKGLAFYARQADKKHKTNIQEEELAEEADLDEENNNITEEEPSLPQQAI